MISTLAALTLTLASATAAPPETASFAVVIANNKSLDGGLADLEFADDDGARYHELLSLFASEVRVLSVLDAKTQRLHPKTSAVAEVPTRAAVLDALEDTFEAIRAAKSAGKRTAFYFVYVGHGSVDDDGEGTMHLFDARFSRSDLFQRVISKSPATVNHVVIDACNAYLLVAKRGAGDAAVNRAIDDFLDREDLDRYPNTGVLLSTSNASDVHEWGRFAAGIFSHEVRSALAGAADVDADGEVTYDEVRAFLYAANGRIRDPRAKLEPFVAAPRVRLAEPLFERRRAAAAPSVHVPSTLADRYFLEDGRGVRFADFNMSPDGPVTMTLVPQSVYFLRTDDSERVIPLDAVASVDASNLPSQPIELERRGAEEISFRRDLFSIPFGKAFYEGFRANPPPAVTAVRPGPEPTFFTTPRVVALGLAGAATAAGVVGAVFGVRASNASDELRGYVGTAAGADAIADGGRRDARTANALFAVGGGLLIGSVVTYVLLD